jgi:hypothetical protein
MALGCRELKAGNCPPFFTRPARRTHLEVKVLYTALHGQLLAEGNGFSGDRESEGSWKQSAGATNRKRIEAAPW